MSEKIEFRSDRYTEADVDTTISCVAQSTDLLTIRESMAISPRNRLVLQNMIYDPVSASEGTITHLAQTAIHLDKAGAIALIQRLHQFLEIS